MLRLLFKTNNTGVGFWRAERAAVSSVGIVGKYFETDAPRLQVIFRENIPDI